MGSEHAGQHKVQFGYKAMNFFFFFQKTNPNGESEEDKHIVFSQHHVPDSSP